MKTTILSAAVLLLSFLGQSGQAPARADSGESAQDVVRKLYELVTFEAGTTPDWDEVRSCFVKEAVVVLRTGREEMSVFTLEGFVDDFVKFIEQSGVEETGFTERILGMKQLVYGDIAHVLVLFDSHVNGSERAPREGLDSFELIRTQGRWKIVSITNERPTRDNPIPTELFE